MNEHQPLRALLEVIHALEDLGLTYAVGGSVASSIFGEPRATADADLLVSLDRAQLEALLARLGDDFYVPRMAAEDAVARHASFNALHLQSMYKVDLFVAGPGMLDQEQLRRRQEVQLTEGVGTRVQVTAPENLILRKLDWYHQGGGVSDQQWRDVLGILKKQGVQLDLVYVWEVARQTRLRDLLERALVEAGLSPPDPAG